MIRQFQVPHSNLIEIRIPEEYIEHQLEILIFPVKNKKSETEIFATHSANQVEDWLDAEEDRIWT